MVNIENDFLQDKNVLSVFYGGSIGNGNTDNYSDIDLRIVVRSEKIRDYIQAKNTRPKNWGNILFLEDVNPNSIYTVVHFDCFVKVDTFYYRPEHIQPSVWLKNIKIIKDTDGMMADIQKQSTSLSYEPSYEEFELWRTKFFAHFHEAYRRAMRDEYYYALKCVDSLRLSMAAAWYMDSGVQPNSFGDWAGYEGERSKLSDRQLELLKSWKCGRNTTDILQVMKSMVPEFLSIHKSLCARLGVVEDEGWITKIFELVI
ncbi:aminoglycoside 6-adenylyltransferase [Virgibacillus kekensis]|uniref:Aminoglycoside 6-adenylyltransferase n=1 Tax=Virgibacillus kekensis TaxID=202261 RepID=A0ABV9DK19_9BACI